MSARPWTDAEIALLRERWKNSSAEQIAGLIHRGIPAVKTKALKLGLRKPRTGGWGYTSEMSGRRFDGEKAQDLADRAADFVRRHDRTQIYRCDADGQQSLKGQHFKYGFGSLVLTEAELIAKAERKGWRPDAWRELAA